MIRRRPSFTAALALVAGSLAVHPGAMSAQVPGSVVEADPRVQGLTYLFEETGAEVPYALFVPSEYEGSRAWPLVVALHGLGRPYDWMMGYEGFIDRAERDGYIVVAPRGYHPRGWYGSRGDGIPSGVSAGDGEADLPPNLGALSQQDVMNVLEIVQRDYRIDPDRIYLWGHSMGGSGAYHLAAEYPELWAAVAVAAPAPQSEDIDRIERYRNTPVLVLHGDQDSVVPVEGSRRWVERMGALGMQHVYVEVPGGDHSSFVNQDPTMISKVFAFFDIARRDQRGGSP